MFGKRLRELREHNNYSMDKLIELYNTKYDAKMNKSTLSRYENELQDPMYTVVLNLANLFGVSVDYITGASDTKSVSSEYTVNKKEIALIQNYRNLNPTGQQKADDYISDLSEQPKYTTKSVSDTIADDIINELKQIATAPMSNTLKRK